MYSTVFSVLTVRRATYYERRIEIIDRVRHFACERCQVWMGRNANSLVGRERDDSRE